jgi:hypothetical protein
MSIPAVRASGAFLLLTMALASPPDLWCQGDPKTFQYDWNAHAVFLMGACWHGYALVGAGGGAEAFVWRGLAIGGDFSVQKFVPGDPSFGLLSMGVGYHFADRRKPAGFDPFISLIIGGAFTPEFWNSANGISGGMNYWFRRGIGLRTEGRFLVAPPEEGVLMVRIGLVFR